MTVDKLTEFQNIYVALKYEQIKCFRIITLKSHILLITLISVFLNKISIINVQMSSHALVPVSSILIFRR